MRQRLFGFVRGQQRATAAPFSVLAPVPPTVPVPVTPPMVPSPTGVGATNGRVPPMAQQLRLATPQGNAQSNVFVPPSTTGAAAVGAITMANGQTNGSVPPMAQPFRLASPQGNAQSNVFVPPSRHNGDETLPELLAALAGTPYNALTRPVGPVPPLPGQPPNMVLLSSLTGDLNILNDFKVQFICGLAHLNITTVAHLVNRANPSGGTTNARLPTLLARMQASWPQDTVLQISGWIDRMAGRVGNAPRPFTFDFMKSLMEGRILSAVSQMNREHNLGITQLITLKTLVQSGKVTREMLYKVVQRDHGHGPDGAKMVALEAMLGAPLHNFRDAAFANAIKRSGVPGINQHLKKFNLNNSNQWLTMVQNDLFKKDVAKFIPMGTIESISASLSQNKDHSNGGSTSSSLAADKSRRKADQMRKSLFNHGRLSMVHTANDAGIMATMLQNDYKKEIEIQKRTVTINNDSQVESNTMRTVVLPGPLIVAISQFNLISIITQLRMLNRSNQYKLKDHEMRSPGRIDRIWMIESRDRPVDRFDASMWHEWMNEHFPLNSGLPEELKEQKIIEQSNMLVRSVSQAYAEVNNAQSILNIIFNKMCPGLGTWLRLVVSHIHNFMSTKMGMDLNDSESYSLFCGELIKVGETVKQTIVDKEANPLESENQMIIRFPLVVLFDDSWKTTLFNARARLSLHTQTRKQNELRIQQQKQQVLLQEQQAALQQQQVAMQKVLSRMNQPAKLTGNKRGTTASVMPTKQATAKKNKTLAIAPASTSQTIASATTTAQKPTSIYSRLSAAQKEVVDTFNNATNKDMLRNFYPGKACRMCVIAMLAKEDCIIGPKTKHHKWQFPFKDNQEAKAHLNGEDDIEDLIERFKSGEYQ